MLDKPQTPAFRRDPADFLDMARATAEMERLTTELSGMVNQVADARTVLEFNSERGKSVFSAAVLRAFKAGAKSTAGAEHAARCDATYEQDMADLRTQYATAERVRLKHDAVRIKVDAVRTLISAQKATLNL